MSNIDRKTVDYLAKLARIKIEDGEMEKIILDLKNILDYISQLNQLNTENIQPANHVLSFTNVCRKDETKSSLSVDQVMKNAPEKIDNLFRVPKII
ncbi:MAG TPA: Asp-tRNA(Asn)/Glu-tRNA(Gln) amidotransferase subunit GatC [bacterium]|nr:Asp-tRNA(Asn)/Glu-tRNA(Gln) amidotransferase subunit GatC [bacterium]HOL49560.1 Asp-tRNA(Asn)/Glu-tRNA(Gln) amidotransferase subunit GatC [bacterium]HPO51970.1 Asp-tRNA(Asn)/Glu-tRNA(Gln) amidotransferase subunit GatC [bacterium]HXK44576.1 Asp-tRNA(Asn)/Glu-tRNA(Gln) amidotransferase subunit GatC [bacterium]